MNKNINDIQKEIKNLKARNKRVETDKAWETSWTRRILISSITYLLIVVFMYIAKLEKPFIGAIIPAIAYLISMSSIPLFKKLWIKNQMKNNK